MLYTGAGDDGMTKLFDCDQQRISKSSEVPEALGALDELNSFIGLVKVKSQKGRIFEALREVQENLFLIQAEIAGAQERIEESAVGNIESIIHGIEKEIPPIKKFCIPGGTETSALLDVARTLARRAERRIMAARDARACTVSKETIAYINRISSLLFALARLANHLAGVAEETPHY